MLFEFDDEGWLQEGRPCAAAATEGLQAKWLEKTGRPCPYVPVFASNVTSLVLARRLLRPGYEVATAMANREYERAVEELTPEEEDLVRLKVAAYIGRLRELAEDRKRKAEAQAARKSGRGGGSAKKKMRKVPRRRPSGRAKLG